MKIKAIVFLLAIILIPAMAGAVAVWKYSGSWYEYECAICGKAIYEWQEGGYGDWGIISGGGGCYHEDVANILSCGKNLYLCDKCREKYADDYYGIMNAAHDNWLEKTIDDNKDLRFKVKEERLKREMQALREEMREIEEKMKDNPFYELLRLEGKIKSEEVIQ